MSTFLFPWLSICLQAKPSIFHLKQKSHFNKVSKSFTDRYEEGQKITKSHSRSMVEANPDFQTFWA